MARSELIRAGGENHRESFGALVADEEGDQVEAGRVGPVEILDHEHDRTLLAEAAEYSEDQLEQTSLPE
jgi:hypothetical protein